MNRRMPLMMLASMALAMGASTDLMPEMPEPRSEPRPETAGRAKHNHYTPYVSPNFSAGGSIRKGVNTSKEEARRMKQMAKLIAKAEAEKKKAGNDPV